MKRTLFSGFKTKALALSVSAISAGLVISPFAMAQEELEEVQGARREERVQHRRSGSHPRDPAAEQDEALAFGGDCQAGRLIGHGPGRTARTRVVWEG